MKVMLRIEVVIVVLVLLVGLVPWAGAQTIHVSPSGGNSPPYGSWTDAAQNIHDAVKLANELARNVLVTNGDYAVTNTLVITNAFRLESVNGPGITRLGRDGAYGSFGVMVVSNAGAFVAGLTVSNGNAGVASGIAIYGGTVSNVTVKNSDLLKAVYIQNALLTSSVISNNLRDALYVGVNGIVQDCVIANNRADLNGYASPVALAGSGALMDRCRVLNNYPGWSQYAQCLGVYVVNGTLRNTLVAGNYDVGGKTVAAPGGVRVDSSGTMENCTIAANTNSSAGTVGRGVYQTGGTIRNSIIYGNGGSLVNPDYTSSGGSIVYSLAPTLTSGTASSNLNINPLFTGAEYQLAVGSPCRDTGTNIAAVTTDIAGTARPLSGGTRGGLRHDMGAWEMNGTSGTFDVGFFGNPPLSGLNSLNVTFRPNAVGSDTNVAWYGWDFNNDGAWDTTGSGMPAVSYTFTPGLYTIVLQATNGLGQMASFTNANYVSVVTNDIYVATNGQHQFPFDTWVKAATNIHSAMDVAVGGCTVSISNGTFLTTKQIVLSSAITMLGRGRDVTVLQRSAGNGILQLAHANAFVGGLMVKGGSGGTATGIDITSGTASNVVITGCGTPRALSIANGSMFDSVVSNNTFGVSIGANGTMERCVVSNNSESADGDYVPVVVNGSGAMMNRCLVIGNYGPSGGGRYLYAFGVRLANGTLRNTLVARNINKDTASNNGPGGVLVEGGTMENCTIVANTNYSASTGGKGVHQTGGTIRNCIIYGNGGSLTTGDYTRTSGTIIHSLAPELTPGAPNNNVNGNPTFSDAAYQLGVGSPCVNTGTNQTWMDSAVDLAGTTRKLSDVVDMGALEQDPATLPFSVGFFGDAPRSGLNSLDVVFHASGVGTIVWYGWDFNNDGTFDKTGANLANVTNTFLPGQYTVVLSASNSLGVVAWATNANYVGVVTNDIYVATNGTHTFPFETWNKASTNVNTAVSAALGGCTVHVSNGVFTTSAQLDLSAAIRLEGRGRDATILQYGAGNGILKLGHANAYAAALTVKGGNNGLASGIYMTGGTASNVAVVGCVGAPIVSIENGLMTSSVLSNNSYGVTIGSGGTLEACVMTNNTIYASSAAPIHLNHSSALANRCLVVDNNSLSGVGRYLQAFGVRLASGTLRNTLVARNINLDTVVQGNPGPGGVQIEGGTMENCTIVANTNYTGSSAGKGVHQTGGTIRNCIIYGNGGSLTTGDYTRTSGTIIHSLAPELTTGAPDNNLNGSPLFSEATYQLGVGSPCVNTGTNQTWMDSAVDLAGTTRKLQSVVDMGAYEQDPSTLPFSVGFYGDAPRSGLNSLDVVFHASSAGTVAWYGWDFNNDGTFDKTGANLANVTNTFLPGQYTVVLSASNDIGSVAWATNANYVGVVTNDIYVATNGTHTFPFETWGKAATNVNSAVAAAVGGCTVHVGPGTFTTTAQLDLSAAIGMEGSGPAASVLQYGAGSGILKLGHANAYARSLMVKGGSSGLASGIHITGGTASNIVLTGCSTYPVVSIENGLLTASVLSNNWYGVAIGANGTCEDCILTNNTQSAASSALVILSHNSALMNRCRIVGNRAPDNGGRYINAVGMRLDAGTARNTLIARNRNEDSWTGNYVDTGGALVTGGTMENCTIVANTNIVTSNYGKGVQQTGGTIRNCIIFGNGGTTVTGEYVNAGGTIEYSMAPEVTHGSGGNITNNPEFASAGSGNWRLTETSRCINTGTNFTGVASLRDLDGMRRVIGSRVDMGCYEYSFPGTVYNFR